MAQNVFLNKKSVFNAIYTENWRPLYTFTFNITGDRQTTEDIIQEIFTDFWMRMEDTEITHHKAYLFQAARNQCAKKWNRKKHTAVEYELLEESLLIAEEEIAEFPKEALIEAVYEKARNILPAKCLEIFRMRFYDHISISEIAERKEISTSTVENQINKALKLLRQENISYIAFAVLIRLVNC